MWGQRSLTFRFIAGAAIVIVAGFALGSVALSVIFERSIAKAIDNYVIRVALDALLVAADEVRPGQLRIDDSFRDVRFTYSGSNVYWQISVGDKRVLMWSQSLGNPGQRPATFLPIQVSTDKGSRYHFYNETITTDRKLHLRLGSLAVRFGDDNPKSPPYVFVVAVARDWITPAAQDFDWALRFSLGILGVILLAGAVVIVHFGLRPLRRIPPALAAIRTGKSDRIVGPFPAEIEPLAQEINALLDQNTQVVERARTHVGNLAHALKTPLAVLINEAARSRSPLADKVAEQAEIMKEQIEHHLSRARTAAQAGVLGARTSVMPVLEGLARTLEAIHRDRGVRLAVEGPPETSFRGERQDLEEMLGNLMDNACKWASGRVRVGVAHDGAADDPRLTIRVEDDGPGLSPAEMRTAVKRGMRIDEQTPGSGLGLAIVQDIAEMYGGSVTLDKAPLGGLLAVVELPAAPSE
jgi:signal transduction histidine kinase